MTGSLSDGARVLAGDIQQNVGTLIKDPSDGQALAALHKDAMQFVSDAQSANGGTTAATNQALKAAVLKELQALEAQGHLPAVNIDDDAQIEATQRVSTTTANPSPDQKAPASVVRDVLADPVNPTQVTDLNFASKTSRSVDQIMADRREQAAAKP